MSWPCTTSNGRESRFNHCRKGATRLCVRRSPPPVGSVARGRGAASSAHVSPYGTPNNAVRRRRRRSPRDRRAGFAPEARVSAAAAGSRSAAVLRSGRARVMRRHHVCSSSSVAGSYHCDAVGRAGAAQFSCDDCGPAADFAVFASPGAVSGPEFATARHGRTPVYSLCVLRHASASRPPLRSVDAFHAAHGVSCDQLINFHVRSGFVRHRFAAG